MDFVADRIEHDFSDLGIAWRVCFFFNTEGPRELRQAETLAKIQRDLSVELSIDLKQTEDHQEVWSNLIHKYFERHEKVFLEAVGAGFGEGGDGNIWTYPGCVLFTVSLLTTFGFGAPIPRTPLGRETAVIFAAIRIPFHFLLILNMEFALLGLLSHMVIQSILKELSNTRLTPIPCTNGIKPKKKTARAFEIKD
ncbi:unnamed protein product [Diabrotica balteata]|uniref:Potassium channel domain-containing protein n=1 Tax=Diabrotica balteata TaxID=107213 RepID=A0A9N9STX5_DIABA|nr:unnamed protein product [Diabrotica balteata]